MGMVGGGGGAQLIGISPAQHQYFPFDVTYS